MHSDATFQAYAHPAPPSRAARASRTVPAGRHPRRTSAPRPPRQGPCRCAARKSGCLHEREPLSSGPHATAPWRPAPSPRLCSPPEKLAWPVRELSHPARRTELGRKARRHSRQPLPLQTTRPPMGWFACQKTSHSTCVASCGHRRCACQNAHLLEVGIAQPRVVRRISTHVVIHRLHCGPCLHPALRHVGPRLSLTRWQPHVPLAARRPMGTSGTARVPLGSGPLRALQHADDKSSAGIASRVHGLNARSG